MTVKIEVFEGRSVKMGVVVFFAVGVSEAVTDGVIVLVNVMLGIRVWVGGSVCVGDGVSDAV